MGRDKKKLFVYLISFLILWGVFILVLDISRNVKVLSIDNPANLYVYTLDSVRVKINFETKDGSISQSV